MCPSVTKYSVEKLLTNHLRDFGEDDSGTHEPTPDFVAQQSASMAHQQDEELPQPVPLPAPTHDMSDVELTVHSNLYPSPDLEAPRVDAPKHAAEDPTDSTPSAAPSSSHTKADKYAHLRMKKK